MGRVVAIVNRKGGVGKTTTTVALADALISELRKNACVIDLDPQASASIALAGSDKVLARAEAQMDFVGLLAARMEHADSSLVPFSVPMVNVIRGRANLRLDVFNNSDRLWTFEAELLRDGTGQALGAIVRKLVRDVAETYDYTLLDCPPGQSCVSEAGLLASDLVICPTVADRLSHWGLTALETYLRGIDPGTASRTHFVITRYQQRLVEHRETFNKLNENPPVPMLRLNGPEGGTGDRLAVIRESAKFVRRLGVLRPTRFDTIYGLAAGRDVVEVAKAIHRELADVG